MFGGVFEELFSPGRKHTSDEHNRLTLARDDDHEDGGPGPIDLDKGIVVIRRPVPASAPETSSVDAGAADSPEVSDRTGAADAVEAGDAGAAGKASERGSD